MKTIKKSMCYVLIISTIITCMIGVEINANATYFTSTITDSSYSKIPEILSLITKQSGSTVSNKINHLLFNSSYAAIYNRSFPYLNSGSSVSTITDNNDPYDVYTYSISSSRGCMAYANYVCKFVYNSVSINASRLYIDSTGGAMTVNNLKSVLQNNAQAGEHIRIDNTHSIAFVAADTDGFYYMNYRSDSSPYIYFQYTSYDNFKNECNSKGKTVWIYNTITTKNSVKTVSESSEIHIHSYERRYEGDHPHRVYMKCSCGDWYYTGETQILDDCEQCLASVTPGKAIVTTDKKLYISHDDTVHINWDTQPNATHYNLWIYKVNNGEEVEIVSRNDSLTRTDFEIKLPSGYYKIYFQTYNSNYYYADKSDWLHTRSDDVFFEVSDYLAYNPANMKTYNNHLYLRFDNFLTWDSAESVATFFGGHLASINSAEEQSVIKELISTPDASYRYWLGGNDVEEEGVWTWSDGSTWVYSNWDCIEPTNSIGWWGSENYLTIYSSATTWNDSYELCDLSFIVEIDLCSVTEVAQKTDGRSTYLLFDNSLPWYAAQEYCKSMGGNLATISSAEKNNLICSLMDHGSKSRYFLGGTDAETEGVWKWVSGETFDYNNWYYIEPNNYYGCENYLMIEKGGLWNDLRVNSISDTGFICEIVRKNNPSAPCAPAVSLIGSTKLTVKPVSGYEYSLDGVSWQSSNTFVNLLPEFEYTVYQRIAATLYSNASAASAGRRVTVNGTDSLSAPYSAQHLVWITKKLLSDSLNMAIDINGDGLADVRDIVRMKKALAGI